MSTLILLVTSLRGGGYNEQEFSLIVLVFDLPTVDTVFLLEHNIVNIPTHQCIKFGDFCQISQVPQPLCNPTIL